MSHASLRFVLAGLAAMPVALLGQSPAEDFAQSCAMCHTIGGGPLAGPDLAGMSERRERSWLIRFIVDPQAVIDSGDPAAQEMVVQYQGMVMPALPGMTPERAAALIDYSAGHAAEAPRAEDGRGLHRGRDRSWPRAVSGRPRSLSRRDVLLGMS